MGRLTPIGERERIVTLDVLRGLALCGVLLSNLFMLYSGRWLAGPEAESSALVDIAARDALFVLVEGKAQNLLTFLFGFGFAAQLIRAEASGAPVAALYVRRMAALFVIGAFHVALLWWGDVTWGYAIAGFALLAFQRVPNPVRVVVGLVLWIAPFAIWIQLRGGRWTAELVGFTPGDAQRWTAELKAAIDSGSYADLVVNHVRYAVLWSAPIWTWYWPALAGRFLIGYVAGVQGWFEREGADRLPLFKRLVIFGLAASIPLAVLRIVSRHDYVTPLDELPRAVGAALYMIEMLAMAGAYVGIVVLAMQRPRCARLLAIVAPVGRMPLTMYILQSVFCTFCFYGWGLGWGVPGEAAGVALGLAIFVVEIVLAHLWLRRFRMGPLEALWRTLVYLRWQSIRRE